MLSNELTRLSLSFDRMFAEHVGCDMSGLKECLMKKSVGDILAAQENITGTALSGDLFLPVVDDNFLHGKSPEKKNIIVFLSCHWLVKRLFCFACLIGALIPSFGDFFTQALSLDPPLYYRQLGAVHLLAPFTCGLIIIIVNCTVFDHHNYSCAVI